VKTTISPTFASIVSGVYTKPADPPTVTACVAADIVADPITVCVVVTVEVAAPPPLLTQMITISVAELESSMATSMPLLEPDFPFAPTFSALTAPRATKSACRLEANASGAAHKAAIAENLMVMIYINSRKGFRIEGLQRTKAALRNS